MNRRRLEQQADDILLKDGRVFYQGLVKSSRPATLNGRASERAHRKRKHLDTVADADARYRALTSDQRRYLRERYRAFNPDKSPSMPSWTEWLVENVDGLSVQGTSGGA